MMPSAILHPRSGNTDDKTPHEGAGSAPAPEASSSGGNKGAPARAQKKNRKHVVTPVKTSLDRRMAVEKNVVDELLLVCGVIGTTTNAGNELVPVTDCLNWLQDLQRALRRDEDLYRPISLLMGKWGVVEQKLLPLAMTCRYDTPIVLTVVKILVILTKPPADNTKRAGRIIVDVASPKADPLVVAQQIKLRQNALDQADQLMEYKRLVTYHPSHHSAAQRRGGKGRGGTGLLSVFVSLLAEPLSKSGASRTDADHLTIELVLHLIRNLLTAEPLLNTSSETSSESNQLHQEMISLFERELVLEILLVVGQEMELRENSQYNLLMMEILHHIFKAQDPTAVAKSVDTDGTPIDTNDASSANPNRFSSSSSSSLLASKLKQEQSQLRSMTTVRHGHFAGTWMRQQADGKRRFVGAAAVVQGGSGSSQQHQLTQARRRNRLAEPFIGSGRTLLAHTRTRAADSGPATKRANRTLHNFCQRFMADCYGPFMKSIKNEFRRDSVRLEEGDKVVFFRLVWFFAQWWRVSRGHQDGSDRVVGRLIITMDVFTFNLVLNATDIFFQHKKFARLAQTVALYSEMMHLLYDMYTSSDTTEHEMAMGLIDRIFYGQEALDRLPKLLSRWTPGTYTREYLCDLAELAHMSLKLLETNTKRGVEFVQRNEHSKDQSVSNKISKMRVAAAEFDVKNYVLKKVVSNQMITIYGHLLGQYKINATVVNHRILAMFLRLMRLEIAVPEIPDSDTPINPLGTKRVTLEPLLYNIQLVMVMEQILNDASILKDKSFESLLQFCTSLMYKFWTAADSNRMLYVECLFRHATPHRYCESVTNLYVDEELRMLALRDILRAEHEREMADYGNGDGNDGRSGRGDEYEDDDDDEELEFTGDGVRPVNETNGTDIPQSSLSNAEDDDDEDDDKEEPSQTPKEGAETQNREKEVGEASDREDRSEPPSKRGNEDSSISNVNSVKASETIGNLPTAKRARLNSKDNDSSDDEIDFGNPSIAAPDGKENSSKSKPKFSINDDSDDE